MSYTSDSNDPSKSIPKALPGDWADSMNSKWPITGSVHTQNDDFIQVNRISGSGAPISFASGSTDTFHTISPPFTPGLIPGLKVWNFDTRVPGVEVPVEDAQTTSPWLFDNLNSSAVTLLNNDADFDEGCIKMVDGGADTNQTSIFTKAAPFRCASGKQWWAETEFKGDDHDLYEFFFGVSEQIPTTDSFHLVAAAAGKDRVGFVKAVHNNDAVTFAASKNGGGTISTALDSAIAYDTDADILNLGIHWDGIDSIRFYGSIRASGEKRSSLTLLHTYSTTAGISDDANMHLVLFHENGSAAARTTTVSFIRGAIWT